MNLLRDGGCYSLPPASPRLIHCAYPQGMGEEAPTRLLTTLCDMLSDWTSKKFEGRLVAFSDVDDGIEKLKRIEAGMALFVLNEEPHAYYDVSYELSKWRVKRFTQRRLCQSFMGLVEGVWDRKTRAKSVERGKRDWDRFVEMSALDVFQQLDGIPWCIDGDSPFDAQLVIDVGHDFRFFAFALLITRGDESPSFQIWTEVKQKFDTRNDGINPQILENELLKFIQRRWPRRGTPFRSLLILRDGHPFRSRGWRY